MTLKQMKMLLCEIYVGYYRANSIAGKQWDEYVDSDVIQKNAWDVWCRMNDRFYTIHIPRWMSHLGTFYVKKEHAGGNIKVYHLDKNGDKKYWRTIPTDPLG